MDKDRFVFQSFWFGQTVSPYEKMCFRSFVDHGHSLHLYTYSRNLDIPAGVVVKDASEIVDANQVFTYKTGVGCGSYSAFSNVFRYKLLYERGGWWVDTDVVCLSSRVPHFHEFFAFQEPDVINGAVLCFEKGDPLMLNCFQEASRIGDQATWGQIGPLLITRMLDEKDRAATAHPAVTCYPIHYSEALNVLRPSLAASLTERLGESMFLHLWNEMFRRAKVSKTTLPPKGSLLRRIADKHNVDGWRGEYETEFLEEAIAIRYELECLREECRSEPERATKEKEELQQKLERALKQNAELQAKADRLTKEVKESTLKYRLLHPLKPLNRLKVSRLKATLRQNKNDG